MQRSLARPLRSRTADDETPNPQEEAADKLLHALGILRSAKGKPTRKMRQMDANVASNLGVAYQRQNRHADAEATLRMALQVSESIAPCH